MFTAELFVKARVGNTLDVVNRADSKHCSGAPILWHAVQLLGEGKTDDLDSDRFQ